jgi:dihydroorotase
VKWVLKGGTLVQPESERMERTDLLISEGQVEAFLSSEETGSIERDGRFRIVPADGRLVTPGLVDMHVHLREPGEEYKETIFSGTQAAAAGGFTDVACMPNTRPVNDNRSVLEFILKQAKAAGFARVFPVASISKGSEGEELAEFGELSEAGAAAFSDDGRPVRDALLMRRALEYARAFDKPIISHPEELRISEGGCMHEGEVSTRLGLRGIPSEAEEIMIFRDIALARLTGGRLHLAHVSTAGSVELIRRAKEEGIRVTAETAPHYFTLTHEAVEGYDTHAKMNPPLRTDRDVQAVLDGLREGVIDAVASDHAPHSTLEKDLEFERAANGIVGLETALGLTLALVERGVLTLFQAIRGLSVNPARILGFSRGDIRPGSLADLTVIDPEVVYTVDSSQFYSLSRNTPFQGRRLKGRAVMTVLAGNPVDISKESPAP